MSDLEVALYVFMLATFVGLEVIRKVSPLLHTPLMSLTNAISAISVVGAILITGRAGYSELERAADALPGFEIISYARACCGAH